MNNAASLLQELANLEKLLEPESLLQNPPQKRPSRKPLDGLDPEIDYQQFVQALHVEACKRSDAMLKGLALYQSEPGYRAESPCNVIWQKGHARLLDYGGDRSAPAIFCIPSLINKSYILDLNPEVSLVRFYLEQGYRPLLLDWDEPGLREQNFDCGDYVYEFARDALRSIYHKHDGPIHVMGYCMGGIFALALAQLESYYIDSLSLFATPWDFKAQGVNMRLMDDAAIDEFETLIDAQTYVPASWVQSAFHMANPWHFQRKYSKLATMSPKERQHFLGVEAWVNDGVPLTKAVAKECLIEWPYNNKLANGQWRVRGWRIDPERIECPTFIAAPTEDRIVPLHSALPLADMIADSDIIQPETGHVSMIVGRRAKQQLWKPHAKWIDALHNS